MRRKPIYMYMSSSGNKGVIEFIAFLTFSPSFMVRGAIGNQTKINTLKFKLNLLYVSPFHVGS